MFLRTEETYSSTQENLGLSLELMVINIYLMIERQLKN